MVLRKKIYIGEFDGKTIYFDTQKNIPLKAENSALINNEKSKNNIYTVSIALIILFLATNIFSHFSNTSIFSRVYTQSTLFILVILWFFEVLFLTKLINNALYKNVKSAIPATKKEFSGAIRSNNIWNIFSNKKVTVWKKITVWLLTLVFFFCTGAIIPVAYLMNKQGNLIGQPIGSEIIIISLAGILPFCLILFIWENNIIRWLNVVDKYQKKKLK